MLFPFFFQFFPSIIQRFWLRPERFCLNIGIHFTSMFICLFIYSDTWANTKRSDKIKIQNYYKYWKDKYFRVSRRVKGGAYIDYQNNQTTCSEALGYGMLISIYMSRLHDNNTRNDFDALNRFRRQFSSSIDPRLTSWYIDDKIDITNATTCATDGDLDIAYALILAWSEWKCPSYIEEAKKILSGIEDSLIRIDHSLRRGDWDINQHATRLSDIMPTHFDVFSQISDRQLWHTVKKTHYLLLEQISREKGAFPDFVVKDENGWKPAPPNLLESDYDGMMYYNSCRVPWRLAAASIENNDQDAQNLLQFFNAGIGKVCNERFKAGYSLDGKEINEWTDGAFTAPHMCSLFAVQRKDATAAKEWQFSQKEKYYQDSIRLLSLLLVTRNTFGLRN